MPDTDPRLEKTAPAGTGPIIASAPGAAWIPVLSLLASMASAALVLLDGSASIFSDDRITFLLSLLLSAVALVLAMRAKRKLQYYLALAGRILVFLLAFFFTADHPVASFLLLAGILAEFSCFETYPINLAETLGIVSCTLAVGLLHAARDSMDWLALLQQQAPLLLFGVQVSLFGCNMTRFREMVVDLRLEKDRATSFMVQLSRASFRYQDLALQARESATEMERLRITRDIHDVVGYTLTNNVMLLEAAMDLLQDNPLALPNILETARANAEEGLGRIRASLYQLRRQETSYPRGVTAIHRLARVFEQATSLRVSVEFGNMPWTLPEPVDSTLYHLVQECLVNSFRHAKAAEVRVVMWCEPGTLQAIISDNGTGADSVAEGIGISGMRERVECLGGSLRVASEAWGFSVCALIPLGEAAHEN